MWRCLLLIHYPIQISSLSTVNCHDPGVIGVGGGIGKTYLNFGHISVTIGDIYLKLTWKVCSLSKPISKQSYRSLLSPYISAMGEMTRVLSN